MPVRGRTRTGRRPGADGPLPRAVHQPPRTLGPQRYNAPGCRWAGPKIEAGRLDGKRMCGPPAPPPCARGFTWAVKTACAGNLLRYNSFCAPSGLRGEQSRLAPVGGGAGGNLPAGDGPSPARDPGRAKAESLRRLPKSEKSASPAPGRRNRHKRPLGRFGRTPVRPRCRSRLRRPFRRRLGIETRRGWDEGEAPAEARRETTDHDHDHEYDHEGEREPGTRNPEPVARSQWPGDGRPEPVARSQ